MSFPLALRLSLAAGLFLVTGCVSWVTPPHTAISSTPPGARVVLDGRPSGFLTPCNVDLDGDARRVRLELAGYEPREYFLAEGGDVYLIPWGRGYHMPYGWRLPFYLGGYDLFFPIRVDRGLSPDRLHATLEPVGTSR